MAHPDIGALNQFGLKDLTGRTLGWLTVLHRMPGLEKGKVRWRCRCKCGTEITVRHDYLLHTNSPKTHCGCKTRKPVNKHKQEYQIWKMMIIRCHDPRHKTYRHYGARGISVCEEWRNDFNVFLRDVGPRPSKKHSLDRADPNGNYEPGYLPDGRKQVTWQTAKHQARNKRNSLYLPHPVTGKLVPAAEVAEYLGVSYQVMRAKYIAEGKWPTQQDSTGTKSLSSTPQSAGSSAAAPEGQSASAAPKTLATSSSSSTTS